MIDGPSADAAPLIAGDGVIQLRLREEALEWTRRLPVPPGGRQRPGEPMIETIAGLVNQKAVAERPAALSA